MAVTEATHAHVRPDGASRPGSTVTVAAGRAARELELRRGEFELAVHFGLITTTTEVRGGRPRVRQDHIDLLRTAAGFPESLRDRVRTAGTAEGADLLGISPLRFTGLARIGCFSPVTFYLNRYRAVVWLYLVDDLAVFAEREAAMLAGRNPAGTRTMLEAGTDCRARNWRSWRIDRLLNRAQDPWTRAAVQASALDPVQLAEVVDDPYERAYLVRVRQEPVFGGPGSVSGREAMGRLMLADDPDEILWLRVNLALELDRAREARPAPRPGDGREHLPEPRPGCQPAPAPVPAAGPVRTGVGTPTAPGLLARIGLRRRRGSDR